MHYLRLREIIVVALVVSTLAACELQRSDKVTPVVYGPSNLRVSAMDPNLRNKRVVAAALTENEREQLAKKIEELLNFCQPILTGLENRSRRQAKKAFWWSLAGVAAGAVIAPTLIAANAEANAAWIAAFSGFGGAMNTVSQNLQSSGLSGSTAAQDRNNIILRLRTQLQSVLNQDLPVVERFNAIDVARAECVLYSISVPTIATSDGQTN